jgi:hypothetical protein
MQVDSGDALTAQQQLSDMNLVYRKLVRLHALQPFVRRARVLCAGDCCCGAVVLSVKAAFARKVAFYFGRSSLDCPLPVYFCLWNAGLRGRSG